MCFVQVCTEQLNTPWWLQAIQSLNQIGISETIENHWPVTSHRQTLSHNVVSGTSRHEQGSNFSYTGSFKSSYHAIMTSTAPLIWARGNNPYIKSSITSGEKKNCIVREIKSTLQTMYWCIHVNTIYYTLKNTCINRKYNR